MTRREIEEKIIALAWKDAGFRSKFLADPKAQFEQRLGIKLSPRLTISAHAEDENHIHFVIPAKPRATAGELSDTDLEKVAGGTQVTAGVTPTESITTVVGSPVMPQGSGW